MRCIALTVLVLALAVAGCSSLASPAVVDRDICHVANSTQDPSEATDEQMDSARDEGTPSPALARLVTAFDNATAADVSAYNSPGDIGGAFTGAAHALTAFFNVQTWCQSNGYGQS